MERSVIKEQTLDFISFHQGYSNIEVTHIQTPLILTFSALLLAISKSWIAMQISELQKIVLDSLEDYKAIDIVDLDIRSLTSIADRMIICTGTSSRHAQSIANNIVEKVKAKKGAVFGVQGDQDGEWILVDLGDIIVHVMLAETRQFYSLEKLWTTAEEIRSGKNRQREG